MLRLKVTPVVGLPQFTGWSQVAESTASVSARLVCVFAVSGKHAGNVGRDVNEKISDFYFYDVQQLHEFLVQLVDFVHNNECKIYFAFAILNKSKSVFATYGGSIFLRRGEKSGKILESDFKVKIVEGSYNEADIFVLTTLQADQFLSEIQQKFIQGYDSDIIITSIVPGLHAQDNSSLSALVFISKDDNRVTEKSEDLPFIETKTEYVDDKPDLNNNFEEEVDFDNDFQKNSSPQVLIEVENDDISNKKNKNVVIVTVLLQKIKKLLSLLLVKTKSFLLWLMAMIVKFTTVLFSWIKNSIFILRKEGIKSFFKRKSFYKVEKNSKRNTTKLVTFFLSIVIMLTVLGLFSHRRKNEAERITSLLQSTSGQFVTAQQIAISDPITARELLSGLLADIEKIEQDNKKSSAISLVTNLKKQISDSVISVSGQEELTQLDTFYDLRLIKADFIASGLDTNNSNVLIYDSGLKQVVLLDYETKKITLKDFSDKDSFVGGVISGNQAFVLAQGVEKFEIEENSKVIEVKTQGDSNKFATLIDAYDRFVYVVNPEKRNIYRYSESEDGYSDPVGWMKSATGLKYDEIRSIAVDGDVWLTTSDGQLKKFTSGREEQFNIRGLEVTFDSDIYVYTNENLDKLYVLDPANSRVVILEKNGDFVREIKSVSLGASSNLAVSETYNKIFVIAGSIIYQINL